MPVFTNRLPTLFSFPAAISWTRDICRHRRVSKPGACLQVRTTSPRPSTESDCGAGIGAAAGTVDGAGAASGEGAIEEGRFFLGAPADLGAGLTARLAGAFETVFFADADGAAAGVFAADAVLVFVAAFTGAGAGVFTAVSGVGAGEVFVRVPTFSASDFPGAAGRWGAVGLARALTLWFGAGAAVGVALVSSTGAAARAEIRKSSIDAPRFLRLCLSQAGFGPRPLHV